MTSIIDPNEFSILIPLIAAVSFPAGLLLYKAASEELSPIVAKIKFDKIIALVLSAIAAVLLAAGLQSSFMEEFAMGVFALGLLAGSFFLADKDNKRALKFTVVSVAIFLTIFFVISAL